MKSDDYPTKKIIVLGVLGIVLGLLSIACGIASAVPNPSSNFPFGMVGYGIWGGVIYIINGIIGIITGAKATHSWILTHLTFSIFACLVALTQFALGVTAAAQDYAIVKMRWLATSVDPADKRMYADLDVYYKTFFPLTFQLYQPGNKLTPDLYEGAVAVDSILAAAGILMAFLATAAIATGCRMVCCRRFMMEDEVNIVYNHSSRI